MTHVTLALGSKFQPDASTAAKLLICCYYNLAILNYIDFRSSKTSGLYPRRHDDTSVKAKQCGKNI